MHITCPHCEQDIALIGSLQEIEEVFKIGPNAVTSRMQKGLWPAPDLHLGNRLIWVRQRIEEAYAREADEKVIELAQQIGERISKLPKEDQEKLRKHLAVEIDGAG